MGETNMEKVERIIAPVATALNTNESIQAISKGLMSLLSVLMIGAFASLFQSLPITMYQDFIVSTGLNTVLATIVNITTNMLALYAVFAITYAYVNNRKQNGFAAGIIALCSFFMITPLITQGEGFAAVTSLPLEWLGSKGLFSAMIIALVTAIIYCFLLEKNIRIKLPDSVPEFISKSFTSIIPGIVIVGLFAIVSTILLTTRYDDLHNAIYSLIGLPLSNLGGSIWAALLIYLLSGLCWFLGIHGIAVVSVVMPIWMGADVANVAAISAGGVPENIITWSWVNVAGNIGGAGCTLGLIILCVFFAKSKQYKEFGKIALVPSLFNINEPVVFGLPCMLNAILFIPFVFLPVIMIGMTYGLTTLGILPITNGVGVMGTPIVIAGFINGGWRLAMWQIVAILISIATYYPFFRILDKQAVALEKTGTEEIA